MNSAAIKLDLLERLASIKDDATIKQMAALLRKTFPEVMVDDDDDISDEEYAAFEEMRTKRLSREVKFLTEEESMAEVRRLIAADRR
ncbi:MAG: hypothetical protein WA937_08030 [Flavobacteriales bacterium]